MEVNVDFARSQQGGVRTAAAQIPPEKVLAHMQSDRQFIEQLFRRANEVGIPIEADVAQVSGLIYALFFVTLHEDDFR